VLILLVTVLCVIYFSYLRSQATETQSSICAPAPKVPLIVKTQFAERDIYEAIFRYRIEQIGRRGVFFLSIKGSDPNDAFMARFSESPTTTIRKNSDAYASKPFSPWILDKSTNAHGVRLFVGEVTWISPVLAEVKGGSQCGSLCADGGIYRVASKNGRWAVIHYKIQIVS
jgi:hypothetical protein